MRTPRTLILSLLLLIASALAVVAPGAAPAASRTTGPTTGPTPTLVAIRAGHHPGFDRVVFVFRGGLPTTRHVRYVGTLLGDASGLPVRVAGRAVLQVSMSAARAHDAGGPTAAARRVFATPNVITTVQSGDFENVTTYGIGLAKRTAFHVFTLRHPSRVVVDVRARFATVTRRAYFLNAANFAANRRPFFSARLRSVRAVAPATGVLDRVFAGPTRREHRHGLRLLLSGSTGFSGLRIRNDIARVRLAGGCDSHGSTVTVAGAIRPALRQFADVRWVKILDPSGATENPTGNTDSIPTCLEP
jgi:hypothetical protein